MSLSYLDEWRRSVLGPDVRALGRGGIGPMARTTGLWARGTAEPDAGEPPSGGSSVPVVGVCGLWGRQVPAGSGTTGTHDITSRAAGRYRYLSGPPAA